jgi:hypothetical protein
MASDREVADFGLWEVGFKALHEAEDALGRPLTDEEETFLAIAVNIAVERAITKYGKKQSDP